MTWATRLVLARALHLLYTYHTLYPHSYYWNILFIRDIHTKSWYGHAGVLDDLILCGFTCAFSCTFQYSLCHGMDIGTCGIGHIGTLVSSTPWLHSQSDWFLGVRCSSVECHQVLLSLFPRKKSISSWFSSWLLWLSLVFLWPLITFWSTL